MPTVEQTRDILLQRLKDNGWPQERLNEKVKALVMSFGREKPEILLMVIPDSHPAMVETVKTSLRLQSAGTDNEFLLNGYKVGVWPDNPVFAFEPPKA